MFVCACAYMFLCDEYPALKKNRSRQHPSNDCFVNHIIRARLKCYPRFPMEEVGGTTICQLGSEPETHTGRRLHSSRLLLPGKRKKKRSAFVCVLSGQVICTQWEVEISFPHEISE